MNDSAGGRLAVLDRHVEGIDDEVPVLRVVDRPADDLSGEGVHHGAAVGLAFSCLDPSSRHNQSSTERLSGRDPVEGSSRPLIQLGDDFQKTPDAVRGKVGAFGEVLPEERRPLAFSLLARCQGDPGSAK